MNRKNTVGTLLEMKQRGEKISMVTCYDYSMSRLVDAAGINTILVGDSLGMTMQGYDTTLPVTMEEMIIYGRSVVRGCQNAFVVMDMPFMSYQVSAAQAVENAGRLIKETNANAVKLEGGAAVAEQIKMIVDAGIPVNAHIGMTPQSVNVFGGFKVQGKGEANARRVLEDALAVQEAGAFMVTLECVPPKLAKLITSKVDMITIGIGAGAGCDGQVLVCQDLLGMNMDFVPKFVKRFGEVGPAIKQAFQDYDSAVKDGTFPALEQSFVKSDCSDEFLAKLDKEY
ncbi:MAG: 3-methyl-2-oxobutanoate hydroxymethyltransferase [Succiniclasticum sp.]|uniref:3-methyl-2-oxobutanoate hydroxymethyltransferase n=1 Tax=Succiniclasticum sp. TaxID=2775030 RepID=UPI002A9095C3|nr:3-methyl-2-oxobutanoate hydroxymethyltransferase [Succiniclasticum sp.]MDY6291953.1 3-methyl-2-oxobutanoate hydroxymethyltransferase [Succiniclasticum sp.]